MDRIVTTRALVNTSAFFLTNSANCTCISIGSFCRDVGTYEQEGRGGEGYNCIEGDFERGNAVIEDISGTGDGWNFTRWISGMLVSEMRGLMQELGWLRSVSKITPL